jgi:hypothetical protein
MNNISVEADKKINSGFKIFESDVRRLIQLALEQIQKSGSQNSFQQYILKFQNGTVAKTTNIEDIFIEDNLGSNKIIMLDILTLNENTPDDMGADSNVNNSLIRITLNDLNSDNNSESNAIRYKIRGFSRDWVMVTSSLIEERLIKFERKRYQILSKYVFTSIMLFMLIVLAFQFPSMNKDDVINDKLNAIEAAYRAGKIASTNELILAIEKSKILKQSIVPTKIMVFPIILLALVLLSDLKIFSTNKLYPLYNFCWGDYLEEYKKIEKRRKFIIGLVIVTIVLGIAINLLSNVIWKKINP